jgi:hypothetical protein
VKDVSLDLRIKILYTLASVAIFIGSCFELFKIAEGTGTWFRGFALTWALIFAVFLVVALVLFLVGVVVVWRDALFLRFAEMLFNFRKRIAAFRWVLAIVAFIFPIYFFQFTIWGVVFQGLFIRLFIWLVSLFVVSLLISEEEQLITWERFLFSSVLMTAAFAVAAALRYVTSYPFALGWSEGNRLWDYSIMFGRGRYIYPLDQEIPVALDRGRQFVGGLPFLIPGVTIQQLRLWVGLTGIIPYLLIGAALFRSLRREKKLYVALVLWTYLFLIQGPIHPPLVLSAVLVVLAWRSPIWVAVPIVAVASCFAGISRYTWVLAPAMWILMLELSDAMHEHGGKIAKPAWVRLIALTVVGLIGGLILPELFDPSDAALLRVEEIVQESPILPENIADRVTRQPLLWYRLFPNRTYGPGILLGLLMAVGPLAFLIGYLAYKKQWAAYPLQYLAVFGCLIAFFVVGIIVSTKIGGGGDLHNMDMFLIGMLLTLMIVWNQGGREWFETSQHETVWVRLIIVCALLLPALKPLQEMRSYNFGDRTAWLAALTNVQNERALDMYAPQEVVDQSLATIQQEALTALKDGNVLFVDQRQLLTFGFITDIPLIPEYDKKVLIERSFTKSRDYFSIFYSELEAQRFSLIIIQPLSTPQKGSSEQFGEENDLWVKWVARPLLCYYEIKQTLTSVNVQLLVPKVEVGDCSRKLP